MTGPLQWLLRYIANRMKTEEEVRKKLRTKLQCAVDGAGNCKAKEKGLHVDDSCYVSLLYKGQDQIQPHGAIKD
jgi:hypothetical protein